jgi:hypothetical protein
MKNSYLQLSKTLCALFFGFMLTALLTNNVHAQVAAYSFAQSTGSYTEITGGTVIATATTNSGATAMDDVNYAVNFAPFSFTYDGTAYTNLNLNSNGYITFGATLPPTGSPYTPISSAVAYSGAVAAFGGDIIGFFNLGGLTSQLRWEIVGTAPNRELVLQWKDFRPYYTTSTTLVYRTNFQIRLKENGNVVEVVYGPSGNVVGAPTSSGTRQIGLRGATNAAFNNRTNSTLVPFTSSSAGGTNTASQAYNIVGTTPGMPSNGLTYTWTPPLPCTSPNPGNTTGPALACNGTPFNLGLQNATPGSGVSYQWYVSTVSNTGPWTPVGPNAAVFAATQTVQSWYYCVVTCNVGPSSTGSLALQVDMDVPNNCHCISTGTSANTQITNVTITGTTTLNNTSAGNAGYANFTAVTPTVSAYPGDVVSFGVTATSDPGRSIFVDWNADGVFDIPAERMFTSAAYVTGTSAGTFSVPPATPAGSYKIRVVANWLSTTPVACNTNINGETEDYTFEVLALTPCAGIPDSGSISSPLSVCSGSSAVLAATGLTTGPGISYQWQESPDGVGSWADVVGGSGATTGTYTTTAVTITRYFKIVTTCSTGPDSNESNVVTVIPNAPACQCTPNPICASNTTNLTDEWISNVNFAGINNPSGSTGYSDFRCVQGSAVAGSTYAFAANVTNGTGFAYTETVRLYIDWNQNNAFGAGEVYDIGSISVPANSTIPFTSSICIPYDAVPGVTNMRVYLKFSTYAAANGCEVTTFGEVEDYWLEVLPPVSAPSNDECANAIAISPVSPAVNYGMGLYAQANVLGNLYGAVSANFPLCGGDQDVFYSLNVPYLNHYIVSVNPFGGFDASLELLDGCGGTSILSVNSFGAGITETAYAISLSAGSYIIRVSGSAASSSVGQFLLNVQAAPTTRIMDGTGCNESDLQLEDVIRCNLVSTALDYEWRFVEVGGGLDASFMRSSLSNAGSTNNRNLRLSWVPGIDYNKLYNVYVRAQFDIPGYGVVWGAYREFATDLTMLGASECTVETGTSVTPTQLRPEYSPNNPVSGLPHTFCNGLVATWVGQAEQFQWELDGPTFHEVTSPSYFVNLGSIAGLQAGQVYQVRVRARVNGLWGSYGVQLPVSIGLPSNTQVLGYLCGTTRALNQAIAAVNTCGASSYTFRFQHATEAERIIVRPAYTCPLWLVTPALTPGETYSVTVKVAQGGVDGDYSTACDITIAGPQAEGLADDMMVSKVATEGGMGIYPNPNTGSEVRVELNGIEDGAHNVEVTIYDIYGKLMTRDVFGHQGSQLSRLVRFETELATGMYLVHVTIDGNIFATEKLIVK